MAEKTVLFEVEGRIATIPLNRPQRLNATNRELRDE
jgi:enoyl-CoA hydratase/carnithine racemase